MKTLATLIVVLSIFAQAPALACSPTSEQLEDWYVRSRQRQEAYLLDLAKVADQILTGVVTDVDRLKDGPYVNRAHITVDRIIKGNNALTTAALLSKRHDPEQGTLPLDRIGDCSEPFDPVQNDPSVLKTYRYLFYIKDGVLIRANGFPLGPPPLEPPEEIQLLQQRALGDAGDV